MIHSCCCTELSLAWPLFQQIIQVLFSVTSRFAPVLCHLSILVLFLWMQAAVGALVHMLFGIIRLEA